MLVHMSISGGFLILLILGVRLAAVNRLPKKVFVLLWEIAALRLIRSEQVSSDMYVSIDLVEEVIERQLRKYKTKLIARHQDGSNFKQEFFDEEDAPESDEEIKIVRTKRFGIKPMYPEDACIQMELLGHDFFVFCNAETDEVNVVYKRKNGTFGLIEPEFQ